MAGRDAYPTRFRETNPICRKSELLNQAYDLWLWLDREHLVKPLPPVTADLSERWRDAKLVAVHHLTCIVIVDPFEVAGQSHVASIAPHELSLYHIVGQAISRDANYQIAEIEIETPGTGH